MYDIPETSNKNIDLLFISIVTFMIRAHFNDYGLNNPERPRDFSM